MEYFETVLLSTIPINIRPIMWLRYVDDIFAIHPYGNECFDQFLALLNDLAPSINFTVEWEKDYILPFLDVKVHHLDDCFSFSVYRKPTHSESYIHFYSFHSRQIKLSVVSNLFLRALRICDPVYLDNEIHHIFGAFNKLGYTNSFIKQALSSARKTFYGRIREEKQEFTNILKLPYTPELAGLKNIANRLENKINVAFTNNNTLRNRLVKNSNRDKGKDDIGIYIVPCKDCNQVYVGETGRNIMTRLDEHKRACRMGTQSNAIANHSLDLDHRINFKDASIICKNSNVAQRKVIEGALIHILDTFADNKAFSQDDDITSAFICKTAKINMNKLNEIAPSAAQSLLVLKHPSLLQINDSLQQSTTCGLTTAPPPQDRPPDTTLRRSTRLRQLTTHNPP